MIFQDPMAGLNPLVSVGRQITEVLRKHLGMVYDICHQAIEYENIAESLQRLVDANVPIMKFQEAAAIHVPISHWLIVCTTLLALFIALSKRRHELTLLTDTATDHRPILGDYTPYLLDQMISVVTASTVIAYAFYTISPETTARFGTDLLSLTIPFPLYGIFRYLYLVHRRDQGGSPAELVVNDRPLLICVALWALSVILIIYR